MTFENPNVIISELPRTDDIEFLQLDRRYARLNLASVVGVELLLLTFCLGILTAAPEIRILVSTGRGPLIAILVLSLLVWIDIYTWLNARIIRYALRQHDLVVRTGLFWRSETIQPLRRVQHVELTRGPLDKRYGLANIKLFSAGTGQSTFVIPGLRLNQAEKIRTYILDYQESASVQTSK